MKLCEGGGTISGSKRLSRGFHERLVLRARGHRCARRQLCQRATCPGQSEQADDEETDCKLFAPHGTRGLQARCHTGFHICRPIAALKCTILEQAPVFRTRLVCQVQAAPRLSRFRCTGFGRWRHASQSRRSTRSASSTASDARPAPCIWSQTSNDRSPPRRQAVVLLGVHARRTMVTRTTFPGSCLQARAAICAGRAGRPSTASSSSCSRHERGVGADRARGCRRDRSGRIPLVSRRARNGCQVAEDLRIALEKRVRVTPTIVLGDVRHLGPLGPSGPPMTRKRRP